MHNITELPAWERLFKKIVWEQIGNLEGKKILDFGSGEGITANHFAGNNEVTAIEPSEEMLSNAWKAYNVTPFVPPFCKSFEEICNQIAKLCETNDKKYIYAYWNQPDTVMHERGCHSKEARAVIDALEKSIEEMSGNLEDTLLIITADHGHIDGKNVVITDYPNIMECLVRLPSIEPRALNLYVKEGKKEQFEREFQKEFGKDFVLLTKEEVYKAKLFGTGIPHENVDAMIGDYLAIAVTDLTIFNTQEEAYETAKGKIRDLKKLLKERTLSFLEEGKVA